MKKIFCLFVFGCLCSGAFADPTLWFGSDNAFGPGSGVVYTNGLAVDPASGWLVELIDVVSDNVIFSTTTGFVAPGTFFATPDATTWNGLTVKAKVYDAATAGAASLFAEFSLQENLSWSVIPAPPGTVNYNAGSVSAALGSGPGEWQAAIPEPAVASFIMIFGGGLLVSKRIFLKG